MTDKRTGLGDDQGTRVGAPDETPRSTPAAHNDAPTGRPDLTLGSGREATMASEEGAQQDHESGYGGKGGAPKKPNA